MTYLEYRDECPVCGEYEEHCMCSVDDDASDEEE